MPPPVAGMPWAVLKDGETNNTFLPIRGSNSVVDEANSNAEGSPSTAEPPTGTNQCQGRIHR